MLRSSLAPHLLIHISGQIRDWHVLVEWVLVTQRLFVIHDIHLCGNRLHVYVICCANDAPT
jgi:hypothetical protein